jgi:hypothetical protein
MTLRRTLTLAGVVLLLASCASHDDPSAGVRQSVDTSWLAGTWRGVTVEVGASQTQGRAPVTLVFATDGSWKASTGASGSGRIDGNRVVLDGGYPEGSRLRYTPKVRERPGDDELWGMVEAAFGHAEVSFKRMP